MEKKNELVLFTGTTIPILGIKEKAKDLADFLALVQAWQRSKAGDLAIDVSTDYDPKGHYLCWVKVEIEYLSEKFEIEDSKEVWTKKWSKLMTEVISELL